jgi:Zn-dependent protease
VSVSGLRKRRRGAIRPSPVFAAFVAVAALGGWLSWRETSAGSRLGDFGVFLLVVGAWVMSLCLHEFAHAYAAYRNGDRSVEAAGYLTLNPIRYAHPVLSLVIPLLFILQGGIGLPGGAVYLHRHNLRSKAAQSWTAAVGPLTNAVFAVVLLLLVRGHHASAHPRLWAGLAFLGFLQLTAAILNLLPVPGLDGWAIVEPYVSPVTARGAEQVKPWGLIGVIVLLQVTTLNTWFFARVNAIYDALDPQSVLPFRLSELGHSFFRFWAKMPL